MTSPPRLAQRWLERWLHPDERQEVLGDLSEQLQQQAARDGARAARRWYWRQAVVLVWGFALHRRDVISMDHERTRGRWFLRNAAGDWRYAWRSLLASRSTSVVALLTLTLSLGLATTVFSLSNALLVQSLPYPNADRLVRLAEARPERGAQAGAPTLPETGGRVSDAALGQVVAHATTLTSVTPYSLTNRNVTTASGTEQRQMAEVGAAFFDLLGVRASHGRVFVAADSQADAAPAAVVSASFWRDALDARDDVVGSTVLIDEEPTTIVGVVQDGLRFPEAGVDVWLAGQWRWPDPGPRRMFQMWIEAVAVLAPDVTAEMANAELRQIGTAMAAADPAFLDGADVPVPLFRARLLQDDLVQPIRPALMVLSVGMVLVLLAAVANLVNLLLARSTARHREMAVRLTLGAGRWRVVRPLLFEQLILAVAGAAGAVVLAWWLLSTLPVFAPVALAGLVDVDFDVTSLAFAAAGALAISLAVGLLPAWQLPRANLRGLTDGGQVAVGGGVASADVARRALVVGQVALSVTLLVGAALLGRTLWTLTRVNPGYVGQGALTFQVGLPDDIFRQPERQTGFFDDVLGRLAQHPRVIAAGASSTLPLNPVGLSGTFAIEGRPRPTTPDEWPRANKVAITPGYLDAVGTRIIRGRNISEADTATAEPVALIDDTTARLYFADGDPIGQRIDYLRQLRRIVGVVEAIKQHDVTAEPEAALYFPAAQMPPVMAFNRLTGGIAIRTTGDPMDLVPFVRTAVRETDPASPVYAVERLDDRLSATFAEPRFYSLVLGVFAVIAMVTCVLGVYGVLAYSVERRQVEFGVRRALGGNEGHILSLVLRQALALMLAGIVLGTLMAGFGTGVLRSLLFGVGPADPATFAFAGLFVLGVGLGAAGVPAWRALRIDPARALRAD